MKQLTFFKSATIVLILLNISMIGFFLMTKPPHPGHPGPGGPPMPPRHQPGEGDLMSTAIELMKLSPGQRDAFVLSAEKHHHTMDSLAEVQRGLLKPYFNGIVASPGGEDTATLPSIQELEGKKVKATYDHFREIQAMLNEDQQDEFEAFMSRALDFLLLDTKASPPPPRP